MKKAFVLAWLCASAATQASAAPGDVVASFPLEMKTPSGLVWDGKHFWISDRTTAKIFKVDPASGRALGSIESPGWWPMGLAWDGARLWNADLEDKACYAIAPDRNTTVLTLAAETDAPRGLAWDGKGLWISDGRAAKISRIDPADGTIISSIPTPTAGSAKPTEPWGLAWDGAYLWSSDRHRDMIYRIDTAKGDIITSFKSPGPFPSGMAHDGKNLWVADYETRMLYKLALDPGTNWIRRDEKHEAVEFVEEWKNFGPGTVRDLEIFIAVPGDLPTQQLTKPPEFEPPPASFVTDHWGQKIARFAFAELKPGETAKALMKVDAKIHAVQWQIDPARTGALKDIPAEIRAKYLVNASKLRYDDPVIQKALKEAVGDEKNPYWIARKIYRYVQEKMFYHLSGGWNQAPTVLSRGSGSCSEYTFVYMALCRAAGLPARYAGSIVIRGDDASMDDVFHRWVEVWLPNYGWVPVDPSGGDEPQPEEQARFFGGLANRFLITTQGGGDSTYLDWDYNANERWKCEGKCKLMRRKLGDWTPVGKKYDKEPPLREPDGARPKSSDPAPGATCR